MKRKYNVFASRLRRVTIAGLWLGGLWIMLLAIPAGVCLHEFDTFRVLRPSGAVFPTVVTVGMLMSGAAMFSWGESLGNLPHSDLFTWRGAKYFRRIRLFKRG